MKRIYTEIRITHKTEEDKAEFKRKLSAKADQLGMTISEYVRFTALHANIEVKVGGKEE